ncbi:MAG: D-alanine--D-alanine ligase [Deltaproteobacteria bacterium CG_4_10_14_0_2_um_filter_43_8]|nr:MAG: D-alanine--D-alanine ligase [Deltaproteobacteria bacterium CG11_big_fil_rev_8_21_14_0_20_42_23]PJA19628.1 MAG: D-alanine--D-alanine ligase [Deltaproteobacteria bacterium CG_4_10_14_0_2_um_filter_43_8]PJC65096.1 MAG: D-alanine--D-alanine ligase [Deltaproteobacteria bacterium CG_4_9_14_0_2_um_filter_42_21]
MKNIKQKKIAVLMGGLSRERDISLKTGNAIFSSLQTAGYNVIAIDVDEHVARVLTEQKPDIAFIALHGKFGEDGCVQGLLECMHIPYTGSGVLPSALAMDKDVCKLFAADHGLAVAKSVCLSVEECSGKLSHSLSYPLVVKPVCEGSTINMSIVKTEDELKPAVEKALLSDERILLEEFIKGTEVTASVLCGEALALIEVVPASGFYDFEAKYTKGKTEYILPARISDALTKEIQKQTVALMKALRIEGAARADYIVDEKGVPYFLEVNTIPGMTETSLVPKAAAFNGMSFLDVCERMLLSARVKEKVK